MKFHELALYPLGVLYGQVVAARRALYRGGVLKSRHASVPVVCVGNVSLGGTGKTPMVDYVVRALLGAGRCPAIVSRGYRRQTPAEQLVVVSDGKRVLASAAQGGDEPVLLARALSGVPVVVCSSRYRAATYLSENALCDVIVLDDGFQHWQLARQADVVLIDATVALEEMRLFPAGTLREPLHALSRARAVVHTKVNAPGSHAKENRAAVSRIVPDVAQFEARFVFDSLVPLAPDPGASSGLTIEQLRGSRVLVFAGVAHPEVFFEGLRSLGAEVVARPFPDHAAYGQAQLEQLAREAKEQGCQAIITTAKDAVKFEPSQIEGTPAWWVLTQRVELDRPEEFLAVLGGALAN